jgi:hypothetical protein
MFKSKNLIHLFLTIVVFGFTQSCLSFLIGEQMAPKTIKGKNVNVKLEENKIIIKVQTRYNPDKYTVKDVRLTDNLSSIRMASIFLNPIKEEYLIEGTMYHPFFGDRILFFEYYISDNNFVIEIDMSQIPDDFTCFNRIDITFDFKFELYTYETNKLIYLSANRIYSDE